MYSCFARDTKPTIVGQSEELDDRLYQSPPWMRVLTSRDAMPSPDDVPMASLANHPIVKLHNEILEFCDLISPTDDECGRRKECLRLLSSAVTKLWPGEKARLEVFGSQATGR